LPPLDLWAGRSAQPAPAIKPEIISLWRLRFKPDKDAVAQIGVAALHNQKLCRLAAGLM
jgi:hypothetical protein